jgi:hypothetical protein
MPETTDTIKARLTPGEFVVRKEAVDMIGLPFLHKINNLPKEGGHSAIDKIKHMAMLENMKSMYGGGQVQMGGYQSGGIVTSLLPRMFKDYFKEAPLPGRDSTVLSPEEQILIELEQGFKSPKRDIPSPEEEVLGELNLDRGESGYQTGGLAGYENGGSVMDYIHSGLDVAGMAPGLGIVPDLINTALYGGEALLAGDPVSRKEALTLMGLSGAAAIPIAGQAATAGKFAKKIAKSIPDKVRTKHLLDLSKKRQAGAKYEFPLPGTTDMIEFDEIGMKGVKEILGGKYPQYAKVSYPDTRVWGKKHKGYVADISPSGREVPHGYQDGGWTGYQPGGEVGLLEKILSGLSNIEAYKGYATSGADVSPYTMSKRELAEMPKKKKVLYRDQIHKNLSDAITAGNIDKIDYSLLTDPFYRPHLEKTNPGYLKEVSWGGESGYQSGGLASYQPGGEVQEKTLYGAGADFNQSAMTVDDGLYNTRNVLSIPAEQVGEGSGLRYYGGEGRSSRMGISKTKAAMDARQQMAFAPQDSIPFDMIEQYLAPEEEQPQRRGLRGLLGFQTGGPVPVGPPAPRQPNEIMQPGQTPAGSVMGPSDADIDQLRMMKAEMLQKSIQQDTVSKARNTLDLIQLLDSLKQSGSSEAIESEGINPQPYLDQKPFIRDAVKPSMGQMIRGMF